jgi:septal ring factor EnvC (AmiA/AmiB activator)
MDEDIKASQAEVTEARNGLRKIETELKDHEKEVATTQVSLVNPLHVARWLTRKVTHEATARDDRSQAQGRNQALDCFCSRTERSRRGDQDQTE